MPGRCARNRFCPLTKRLRTKSDPVKTACKPLWSPLQIRYAAVPEELAQVRPRSEKNGIVNCDCPRDSLLCLSFHPALIAHLTLGLPVVQVDGDLRWR
jgi:hypothetical protein